MRADHGQMVAAAMGIPTERNEVTVQGELDLRGTLGIARDVPVGFETIQLLWFVRAKRLSQSLSFVTQT